MPHQLRRIIAINIRNPSDSNPSGRISELDPRGGVLAVGDNGVGKTTFLRLIPLFYGATPSQVLKGSGKSSMIRHTLPDPSSAVAYEYERESNANLRTVVMYAKDGEDIPDFRIVSAGFDETFFYDENNMFVTRTEFAPRLHARNINVSPVLQLNEYRSVILNERMSSKNAKQMALLARDHSLGPRPLRNLNQIAAAMANEKISFRDLQNIVLERVAEDQATESKRQNVRELKQRREDVTIWLDSRTHMAEILKRKPDADRMKDRIGRIKGVHLELCSLHVAVKAALAQAATDQERLTSDRKAEAEAFEQALGVLNDDIREAGEKKTEAHDEWQRLNAAFQAVINRQNHFDLIDAKTLAGNESRESALQQQARDKEKEHERLTSESGSHQTKHERRCLEIEQSAQRQQNEIAERKATANRAWVDKRLALGNDKDAALQALEEPPRLVEIAEERNRLATREGEITQKIKNPAATPETLAAQEEAVAILEQRRQDYDAAKDAASDREKDESQARRELEAAIGALEGLEASQKALLANIEALTAQVTSDAQRLQELRDQKLNDYLDFVHSSAYIGRPMLELDQEVTRKLRTLVDEAAALRSEVLSLRNEFEKKEGGPNDWLKLKRKELPDRQTRLEHEYLWLEAEQLCDWFERTESGSFIEQLTHQMNGFFENASVFVSRLDTFDRLVATFNTELGRALATAEHFERFKNLSVRVTSSVGQQAFLSVLRKMRDKSPTISLTGRAYSRVGMELPSDEDTALVREYKEILRSDGGVQVDLNEQVRLEFSLYENGKRSVISNEEEFRAVSSNGNSALITAMFLMGFVQMIRGSSPVRLVWVTDELGRFDAKNVGAFLKTLALNNIDVISASPSVDPALARHFPRLSLFENTGAIFTNETHELEAEHELA